MADIIKFDSGAAPGVKFAFDDVAIAMNIYTRDDGGALAQSNIISNANAQRAVELASGTRGGVVDLDSANGLIWAIAPDNTSMFSVQKDANTPQQVTLTAAQTAECVGWLVALLPQATD